ncbi:hypothetical protein LOTGIDRAFT_141571, partial [Lottia gigantea]
GKPEPSIRWFREGKELTDQADFEITYRQGRVTLTIPEVFEEDEGHFTATAENIAGSASSTAELIVRGENNLSFSSMIPPSFTEKLSRHEASEGQPVKLTVRVSGHPPPQVTWMREGSKLVSSRDFEIVQEGDIHSLYIPEVFYEDSGKYTVKAENPAGEAQCIAQLVVERKWKLFKPEQPPAQKSVPYFSQELNNVRVKEGESVTFEIRVHGYPEPIIRWFRNDQPVESSPDYEISYSQNLHRLTIIEVFPEDAGRFKCVASNALDSKTTECHLIVEGWYFLFFVK